MSSIDTDFRRWVAAFANRSALQAINERPVVYLRYQRFRHLATLLGTAGTVLVLIVPVTYLVGRFG